MTTLALIRPALALQQTWLDQQDDWGGPDVHMDGASQPKADRGEDVRTLAGWDAWVARLHHSSDESVELPEGLVHATAFWLIEVFPQALADGRGVTQRVDVAGLDVVASSASLPDGEAWVRHVGAIQLRHRLTEKLRDAGGHIGYGVRPSARRRGYASWMLGRTLAHAQQRGLDEVMISCDVDNLASAGVIVKHGGRLDAIRDSWLGMARLYTVPTRRQSQ